MIETKMVLVEGGLFMMGGESDYPDSKPIHPVTLSSFYIGQFTVTQKEWKSLMRCNVSNTKGDDLPVTNVSWNSVQKFLAKLNLQTDMQYRLPTEAEWEYAARGGNLSEGFEYAGSNDVNEVAWHHGNSEGTIRPGGQKKANELGLYDMSGNVREWCQDLYDSAYYENSPSHNPTGPNTSPTGRSRVFRGGSWGDHARNGRVTVRNFYSPTFSCCDIGFRLVHDFETFKNK